MRYPDVPRYIASGIPAVLIVASALLLERIFSITTKNRALFLLGEASYIIYLIHPYVVYGVLRVLLKDAEHMPPVAMAFLVVGLLALVSGIAVVIHLKFERPVMAILRSRLPSSRQIGAPIRSEHGALPDSRLMFNSYDHAHSICAPEVDGLVMEAETSRKQK
jgi:peptidoglycan/LPS O-acetylase OafA/YrhL